MSHSQSPKSVPVVPDGSSDRVCAAMVTYNPDLQVADRIACWRRQVSVFCVIDNGSGRARLNPLRDLAAKGWIVLIENRQNLGIAAALNQAIDFAKHQTAGWLLTVDQDSEPITPEYVGHLFAALASCCFAEKVAIVGGRAVEPTVLRSKNKAPADFPLWRTENIVITSGSLYRLDILDRLGGFRTDLFIDGVDTEYCLRLHLCGLRVIVSDRAGFYHRYGEPRVDGFGPFRVVRHLYPPTRNYYRFRNNILLAIQWRRQEPAWAIRRLVRLVRLVINIIVFHERKSANLRMARRGIWDGLRGKTGPLRLNLGWDLPPEDRSIANEADTGCHR
ncbi:MAG: glycosyltransferase [Thermodesulfobacteriota bacterium]